MASTDEESVYARAIAALALNANLSLSPWHYELIGDKSTRTKAHGTFAVAITRTDILETLNKQRLADCMPLTSQVGVRVICNLRQSNQSADYQAALGLIQDARAQMMTSGSGTEASPTPILFHFLSSTSRTIAEGTHLLCDLSFTALHQLDDLTP